MTNQTRFHDRNHELNRNRVRKWRARQTSNKEKVGHADNDEPTLTPQETPHTEVKPT